MIWVRSLVHAVVDVAAALIDLALDRYPGETR